MWLRVLSSVSNASGEGREEGRKRRQAGRQEGIELKTPSVSSGNGRPACRGKDEREGVSSDSSQRV